MTSEEAWLGLVTGRLGLHEVPPFIAAIWDDGYQAGLAAAQPQIAQAQADANRYYRAMCSRPAPRPSALEQSSLADLSRVRGERALADRLDAQNAALQAFTGAA